MADPPSERRQSADFEKRGWGRTFESLSIPEYRWLWIGALTSFAALQMTQVARPWLAYHVSDSALVLGLVAAVQGLPQLIFAPLGGLAADRLPKRLVLHVSTAILMTTALVMAIIVYLDIVQVWHLVVLSLVHGSTVPFNQPVRQSYIPVVVPRSRLSNAVALNASGRNINQILGPSIAGVLLSVDPFLAFAVIFALHVVTIVVAFKLPFAAPEKESTRSPIADLLFGLTYVWRSNTLRTLIGLALVAVVFGQPFQQLLTVFQKDVLHLGPEALGFMYASVGAGALIASLVVASFSGVASKGFPQLLAGMASGVALIAFALSPVYWLTLILLFLVGFTNQSYNTMNQTLLMLNSAPEFFGRVASVNIMTRAMMPIIVLPYGALTDAFGAPTTVASGGVLMIVTIVLVGAVNRGLWRTRTIEPASPGGF